MIIMIVMMVLNHFRWHPQASTSLSQVSSCRFFYYVIIRFHYYKHHHQCFHNDHEQHYRVFTFDDLHYSPSFHDVNEDKNNNNSNNEGYATKSPLTPTTYIREKLHASTIVDKSTSLVTNPSINIPNGSVSSDKLGSIINNESIDLSSVSCKMNVDGQAKAYNGVRVVSQHVTNFITTSETNHNSLVSSTFQHYSPTFVTTKAFSTFVTTKPSSAFVTTKSSSTSTKSLLEAPKVHHCGVCDKVLHYYHYYYYLIFLLEIFSLRNLKSIFEIHTLLIYSILFSHHECLASLEKHAQ